jgi:imidazolonepropionase-like amidohydrolase
MRVLTLLLSLALALPSLAQTVVFRDVNVISMTSPKVAEKQTVVVSDGKIGSILKEGAMVKLPEGTTIIDGSGKYLIPGLADMHAHIPPPNSPAGLMSDVLALYLANGITTVRSMLGHDGQLQVRAWAKSGEIVSPNLYLAGPSFNGQSINSPQEAIDKVRAQKKEGWDMLKVHPGLTRPEYDAMAKTAKAEGMRFVGHVPEEVGLLHAIEMGQETFDHIDGYIEYLQGDKGPVNEKKLADVVRKSKKAGVWIVPTSALWAVLFNNIPLDTLKAYPELKYVPDGAVATWSTMYEARKQQITPEVSKNVLVNRTRILRALYQGGVKILMGTDAPQQFSVPGFSLHREVLFMRDAGMTPYDILKSGTVNAGLYFAKQDSFGTIETGKRADLVLLNANPLTDIQNIDKIEGVMVRGRWFSRKDLDDRLAGIAAKYPRKSVVSKQ